MSPRIFKLGCIKKINLIDNYARDPGSFNTAANQQNGEVHIFYKLTEIKLNEINNVDDSELNE